MASIPLALHYIILLIALAASGWLVFASYYLRIKRFAPEAAAFSYCRRNNLPLCEFIDGNHISWAVEKSLKSGSIMTRIKDYGMGIDPKVLGSDPSLVAEHGLRVYHRSPAYVTDLPPNHIRANIAIIEYARNTPAYADLLTLSDEDIIALCGTNRADLEHDVQAYIDKKDPMLSADRLISLIMNLQDDATTLPIKSGFFSYLQGIRLNPARFTPQNFEAILNIMRAEAAESYHTQFDDYVKIGTAAFLVLIGVAFAAQKLGMV